MEVAEAVGAFVERSVCSGGLRWSGRVGCFGKSGKTVVRLVQVVRRCSGRKAGANVSATVTAAEASAERRDTALAGRDLTEPAVDALPTAAEHRADSASQLRLCALY